MAKKNTPGLPTRQQILDFIESSDQPARQREIARAFGLRGHDTIALNQLLHVRGDEELLPRPPARAAHGTGGVPTGTVLRVRDVPDSGRDWAVRGRGGT